MKKKSSTWILTSLLALSGAKAAADVRDAEFRWRLDLEPARRDALAAGKPFLVVFR